MIPEKTWHKSKVAQDIAYACLGVDRAKARKFAEAITLPEFQISEERLRA